VTRAQPTTHPLSELIAAVADAGLRPDRVLAAVAQLIAAEVAPNARLDKGGPLLDGTIEAADLSAAVPSVAVLRPELLGHVLELLHEPDTRRRRGAFFTPRDSATRVVALATDGWRWPDRPSVCDPACGGGVFLLAAGDALEARGIDRDEIVTDLLWGMDSDPLAVAVTQAALALWCASGAGPAPGHVVGGDALADGLDVWDQESSGFDLVVGNPPFQSQLATRTARTREQASAMAQRFGGLARGYADAATLFLVAASTMTRPRGRFSLILPESFLATRDATAVRQAVVRDAELVGLWLPGVPLFAASVRVCVPVFEVARPSAAPEIRRWKGVEADEISTMRPADALMSASTWSPLAAASLGIPDARLRARDRLGAHATATAGFRDQFYGLRPFVHPARDEPSDVRLITSGAIDLANSRWARRVTRFAGTSMARPVVDLGRLRDKDPALGRWAERVLVPKVLVATQTRVVEVIVDEGGDMWPSVPVVAVVAAAEELWPLAAALASPPVSADSLRHHAGSALSSDAIKLSAKQILEIGLPCNDGPWERGTACLRNASDAAGRGDGATWMAQLEQFGADMCEAYDVSDDVLDWWLARLPPFR
jgi:hypothetical protein